MKDHYHDAGQGLPSEALLNEGQKKRKKRDAKNSASYQYLAPKIGTKIRNHRTKMNLTQTELADAVNITVSFLSDIEHARTMPSIDTFIKICYVLKISPVLPELPDAIAKKEKML